jgi:hypothetical protein
MENSPLRMAIGAAAMFALLTLPSAAVAETVVPPGNSAATQYTETFPTPGGNAKVNGSIGEGGGSSHGGGQSPSKALGSHTAEQLESHGQEGRTVAALAAEATPSTGGEEGGESGHAGKGGGTVGGGGGSGGANGTSGGSSKGGGGSGGSLSSEAPAGSSGFSEVLSHATGSSSGEMGIFLPLVLLAAPLCALAYAWRRRQPGRAAP